MAVAKAGLTLEQFLRIPEQEPPLEYEDGRVTQKVSPQPRHGRIQVWLATTINVFAEPRRLATAIPELRTTYANRSLVPDIAVYRWERIPLTEEGEIVDGAMLAPPDMAIEITSPDQSLPYLIGKCRRYTTNGVPIALLVDVAKRSVRAFRPGRPEQLLRGSDRVDLDDVLPGFELTVEQLFGALRFR